MRKILLGLLPALFLAFSPVMAYALDSDCVSRVIRVENHSDYPVLELYISCVDCNEWGLNFLSEPLESGWWIAVNGDFAVGADAGYHVFDFRAVSPYGEWTQQFDICTTDVWNLYN